MKRSVRRILTIIAALAGLYTHPVLAQVAQPQLETFRLQPTSRWSPGMNAGYSDGHWVPVRAVLNQQHLEVAANAAIVQGLSPGSYLVGLIRTTFNSQNQGGQIVEGNSINHVALQGTYAAGQSVMIENGSTVVIPTGADDANAATSSAGGNQPFTPIPFVFGVYPAGGGPALAQLSPILPTFRRGAPIFPGSSSDGAVGQVIGVMFTSPLTPAQLQTVVLQFAVQVAPPGLLPVDGGLTGVAHTVPGCSGYPGPGNNFIGFFVTSNTSVFQTSGPVPTGVAAVPLRCVPAPLSCQISGMNNVFAGQTAYYSDTVNLTGVPFTWSIIATTGSASATVETPTPDGMVPVTFTLGGAGTVTLQLKITQGSIIETCTLVITVISSD